MLGQCLDNEDTRRDIKRLNEEDLSEEDVKKYSQIYMAGFHTGSFRQGMKMPDLFIEQLKTIGKLVKVLTTENPLQINKREIN